jgi:hypothetical protein
MKSLVAVVTLTVAASVALIVVVLSGQNTTSWTELDTGDCFDLAGAIADADGDLASVFGVDPVACGDPHDAEVVGVGSLNPSGDRPYPDDDALFAEVEARCSGIALDERFAILPIVPDERTWDGRTGRYVCVAVVIGGGTVEGSNAFGVGDNGLEPPTPAV